MQKKLPIGISNFEELIRENYYFVDKSLLIKELLDTRAKVTLIPRPRRFGKTLNMSMLQCFFEKTSGPKPGEALAKKGEAFAKTGEKTEQSKRDLFNGLKIEQHADIMAHQGQSPVIFITFKDIKVSSWEKCWEKITEIISLEYERHSYLIDSSILLEHQKNNFKAIIDCTARQTIYESALKNLSTYLAQYHNKKPIILIDEYDEPIHTGFLNDFYDDIINFMRSFLCAGLKDNNNLDFGVLTGILRVARESIFNGMNNLRICSFIHPAYAHFFGLLEYDVQLKARGIEKILKLGIAFDGKKVLVKNA